MLEFGSEFGHLFWLDSEISTCVEDAELGLGPFALLWGKLLELGWVKEGE